MDGGREGPAIDLHGVHAARGHRQQLCAEKAFGDLSRLENEVACDKQSALAMCDE